MAPFIFDCPCCRERQAIELEVHIELPQEMDDDLFNLFVKKYGDKAIATVKPSPEFKKWQEAMA